uniref:Glycosyltransferase 1 domain containing 1 n=1 Tax=Chelydra serpentina TaxID=8475 RepID=A0A8C3T1Y7_CHESE
MDTNPSSGIPQDTENLHLFLLICGLRRVKDPLYLVDVFSEWHRREPHIHLLIIGPAVSCFFCFRNCPNYAPFTSRAPGVHLLQEIPQDDLHAAVKRCFAVVNSSISEGMSAAILEVITSKLRGKLNRSKLHNFSYENSVAEVDVLRAIYCCVFTVVGRLLTLPRRLRLKIDVSIGVGTDRVICNNLHKDFLTKISSPLPQVLMWEGTIWPSRQVSILTNVC